MPLDPNEAAKRVLINYRQLGAMLKDPIGVLTAKTSVDSYNRILDSLVTLYPICNGYTLTWNIYRIRWSLTVRFC